MANTKMIGALLGTFALGTMNIALADEAPKGEKAEKGKKKDKKAGGEKSCGGEKGCSGDKK
jgi:hypothetical protein